MYNLITSPQNQQVKRWKKLQTKKGRRLHRSYLIEGTHLLLEANTSIEAIIVNETFVDVDGILSQYADSVPIYQLPSGIFHTLAETEKSQGILAEAKLPNWDLRELLAQANTMLLLDAVQDPGNLGTIIRTAWASGVDIVVLGKGTVDPYNSKVVRSTMGALFHVPVIEADLQVLLPELREHNIAIVGTSPHNGAYTYNYSFPERVAIVLGNEGRGIEKTLLSELDQAIIVPMPGNAESYNVSITAAMVLYERIRQQYVHK